MSKGSGLEKGTFACKESTAKLITHELSKLHKVSKCLKSIKLSSTYIGIIDLECVLQQAFQTDFNLMI